MLNGFLFIQNIINRNIKGKLHKLQIWLQYYFHGVKVFINTMHNHMQSMSWFSFDLSNMKSLFSTKVNDFQVPCDMLISIEKPPGEKSKVHIFWMKQIWNQITYIWSTTYSRGPQPLGHGPLLCRGIFGIGPRQWCTCQPAICTSWTVFVRQPVARARAACARTH